MLYIGIAIMGVKAVAGDKTSGVYISQIVDKRSRSFYLTIFNLAYCFCSILLPAYYYYVGSYKYLFIFVASLAFLSSCVALCLMPESPRFHMSKERYLKARRIFNRVAIRNRAQPLNQQRQKLKGEEGSSQIPIQNSRSLLQVLKGICRSGKSLIVPLCIFPLNCFFLDLVNNSITFGIGALHQNIYLIGIIVGVGQVMGNVISGFLANIQGRKYSFILACLFSALGSMLYLVSQWTHLSAPLVLIFILFVKVGNAAASNIHFIFLSETFPTEMRASVNGFANIFGKAGGALGPILIEVLRQNSEFMIVMVSGSVLMACASCFLKETKNKEMIDSLPAKGDRE